MAVSDQTELFRAMVKATRKRAGQAKAITAVQTDILKQISKRKTTPFGKQAKEIARSIAKLQHFIEDVRKDYLDLFRQATGTEGRLTERERDEVEKEANDLVFVCHSAINTLKDEANMMRKTQNEASNHGDEHRQAVILLVQEYLARTTKELKLLQASRVRLAQERQRLTRPAITLLDDKKKSTVTPDELYGSTDNSLQETLTQEELSVLEQENSRVFEDMSELTDSVKDAERKVLEISRLHQLFSENVLQQANDLDHLYDSTVETTENVVAGNEKLQQVSGAKSCRPISTKQ